MCSVRGCVVADSQPLVCSERNLATSSLFRSIVDLLENACNAFIPDILVLTTQIGSTFALVGRSDGERSTFLSAASKVSHDARVDLNSSSCFM